MEDPRKLSLGQYWSIAQPTDPRCTCFQTTQDTNQDSSHYNFLQDKQEFSFTSHSASSLNSHLDGDENTSYDSSVSISTQEADSEAHSPKAEPRSSLMKTETKNKPSVARKSAKQRKTRILFSPGQINVLEQVFKQYHYIASSQRKLLAQNIGISEAQVRVWFQNRRIKWRKEGKEFLVKM